MMTGTSALEPEEYLRRLFDDLEFSYLVVVAAQLGVADLLAPGPQSIADLSAATAADAQSLYRVLRALASRGLFRGRRRPAVHTYAAGGASAPGRRSQYSSSGTVER
jgi:hypothetical protein